VTPSATRWPTGTGGPVGLGGSAAGGYYEVDVSMPGEKKDLLTSRAAMAAAHKTAKDIVRHAPGRPCDMARRPCARTDWADAPASPIAARRPAGVGGHSVANPPPGSGAGRGLGTEVAAGRLLEVRPL
jgi:hypothetical protein